MKGDPKVMSAWCLQNTHLLRLPRKAALSVIERIVTRIASSKKEFIKALPQFSQIKNTKLKDMIA